METLRISVSKNPGKNAFCKEIRMQLSFSPEIYSYVADLGMTLTLEKPSHSASFLKPSQHQKCPEEEEIRFKAEQEDGRRGKRFYEHLMTSFDIAVFSGLEVLLEDMGYLIDSMTLLKSVKFVNHPIILMQ